MSDKPTLAVDFDGVIHRYSDGWQDGEIYDPPMAGAADSLARLAENFRLVVFTARDDLTAVQEWLEGYGLDDLISEVTNKKPQAVAYVDDKAVRFESWDQAMGELTALLGLDS